MTQFKRGIRKKGMIEALAELAAKESWWRDVLHDRSLIIGVRDNKLNVYWCGQSIFDVEMKHGQIIASTHPKYLLDPGLSQLVSLCPETASFKADPDQLLIRSYVPGKTLGKLKRAAERYAGREKCGVQEIAEANLNLVDVEIAFPATPECRSVPRIDFATLEVSGEGVQLIFWEAKRLDNQKLVDRSVISQLSKYDNLLIKHYDEIIESYRFVASNLSDIARMSGGARSVAPAVQQVANGESLQLADNAKTRLVVFGFTEKQREEIWKPLLAELEKELGSNRVLARGKSKGWRLRL